MDKILLIDGNSILNRAYYAIPYLTNKNGVHTNAVYGFLNMFFKFINEENTDYVGVAFDLKKPTFRHKFFSEYKGTRSKTPSELISQITLMKELLIAMGVSIFEKEGYEADDILGTLANKYENKGNDVTIITGDRDLLQLATEKIQVRIPKTSKGKTTIENYYKKEVIDKYEVTPKEFIDVKALMGDSSDNIPGVPGIGEKTAIKLIKEYKSLENLLENLDIVKPQGVKTKLINNIDSAKMSKYLATIIIDVPIENEVKQVKSYINEDSYKMLKELELKTIIEKYSKKDINSTSCELINVNVVEIDNSNYDQFIKKLNEVSKFAIKLFYEEDELIGVGISIDKEIVYYVSRQIEKLFIDIKKIMESETIKKVVHGLKYEIKYYKKFNIDINNYDDLKVMYYAIDPNKNSYMFSEIAYNFLDLSIPSYEDIFGKGKNKKNLKTLNKEEFNKYIYSSLNIMYIAQEKMKDKALEFNVYELLLNIEYPLIKVLADMESVGIKIDREYLKEYRKRLDERVFKLESEIYIIAGRQFNINSPKQLGIVLFEELKLPVIKKTKTGYSTNADVLEKLIPYSDIISKIIDYRHLNKLKTTYSDGLVNYIDNETDKIYTTFKQTITATGRLSSTNPNLQNIPIKLEYGRELRKIFIPESEEYIFLDADYSQIELRILAHMSNDKNMISGYNEGADIHRFTASQVFNIPYSEVTKEQRSAAKAVNFGIVYGISSYSLSQDINVTKKEADGYIEAYFEKYSNVKKYLEKLVVEAKEKGYVTTLFGRRRDIPEIKASNFIQRSFGERIAMNTPIQGTGADIIKMAMIKVYNKFKEENMKSKILLQVHDELLIQVYKTEEEKVRTILNEMMQNVVSLKVPLVIDVNKGENWLEAH